MREQFITHSLMDVSMTAPGRAAHLWHPIWRGHSAI